MLCNSCGNSVRPVKCTFLTQSSEISFSGLTCSISIQDNAAHATTAAASDNDGFHTVSAMSS